MNHSKLTILQREKIQNKEQFYFHSMHHIMSLSYSTQHYTWNVSNMLWHQKSQHTHQRQWKRQGTLRHSSWEEGCKGSKSLDDLFSTGDGEFSSTFNICNLHLQVFYKKSKPLRASAESLVCEVELQPKSMGVLGWTISKELHMLVLWECFGPWTHHKWIIDYKIKDNPQVNHLMNRRIYLQHFDI